MVRLFPGFDRRVWLILFAMLALRFGQGLYFPFSTIHFHNVVGIPLSLVGTGLGALAVASVLSGLVSGPLSDRYGSQAPDARIPLRERGCVFRLRPRRRLRRLPRGLGSRGSRRSAHVRRRPQRDGRRRYAAGAEIPSLRAGTRRGQRWLGSGPDGGPSRRCHGGFDGGLPHPLSVRLGPDRAGDAGPRHRGRGVAPGDEGSGARHARGCGRRSRMARS